jgi:hypothetical protein
MPKALLEDVWRIRTRGKRVAVASVEDEVRGGGAGVSGKVSLTGTEEQDWKVEKGSWIKWVEIAKVLQDMKM